MGVMAKHKNPPPAEEPSGVPPSRANTKYVPLPLPIWEEVQAIAQAEDRSISWVVRRAVRQFLDARKKPS